MRSYRDVFEEYRIHPEAKAAGLDGEPCSTWTTGQLQPLIVDAIRVVRIGKETNRLAEDLAVVDDPEDRAIEYREQTCEGCGEALDGRPHKRWCSDACRKRAKRTQRDSAIEAGPAIEGKVSSSEHVFAKVTGDQPRIHRSSEDMSLNTQRRGGVVGSRRTATSSFGVGRREGHDASGFYERFVAPKVSSDSLVSSCSVTDQVILGDARRMEAVEANSVALVVTSPPYFAGKDYESDLTQGHVPSSYIEYLDLLHHVFEECWRVLEPGGRIAVNVANLGRKPYRSLSADVIRILQDDLGFLLRGEIIWRKGEGASGNCAWGSFASAANPVLRDLTERVVIACKGRFDRAISRSQRKKMGLPYEDTISKELFMECTLDVWELRPESAKRVGHPAPFPVELPERLIQLFTYRGDVVLDPFLGSGTAAVAALRTDRRYVGYDNDAQYVALAQQRIESERRRLAT